MIDQTISHYKILEKLGGGGMGVVYKAQDLKLDRFVALKFLPHHLSADDDEKKRFIHEAKAASALDHPNICTIYEIDETEDGELFIAMAFYEGETLKKKVSSDQLSVNSAIEIAIQIAQGLARAHEAGIIHRDIKPANIMITNRGEVKIVDFGLAKLAGRTKLTKEGTTLGTVAYMSPEQTRGEDVDYRTDIWSFGVVLYEMITGQPPFKGEYDHAVMYSIMNVEPEPITGLRTGVPMELERVANKCLEKQAMHRYQHADDLLADLRRLQMAPKSTVRTSPKVTAAEASKKRLPTFVFPVALLVVAIILGIGYYLFSRKAESQERIPIAVVDFVNATKEEELNGLSGMLITSLEQSRRLSVLTRSRMFDVLKQMGRENVDRIDEALGREICRQANVKALVTASIRKFDRLYTVDLKVLDPVKNEYLFTTTEREEGQASIPAMIDKLAEKTRRGLNERAAEIQAASQKIAEVTTVNLEAYQHYFKGEELINKLKFTEAEEEFKKAIALDTTFALAYYRLAWAYTWWGVEKANEPRRKAMRYIKNAPIKEQYFIRARNAETEEEALAIYQELLKMYPEEKEALWETGDLSFHQADYAAAIMYLEKVLAMDPTFVRALQHMIWTYMNTEQYGKALEYAKQYVAKVPSEEAYYLLGDAYSLRLDFDHALQTYRQALEVFPKSTLPMAGMGSVYIFKNEYEQAKAEFEKLLQEPRPLSDKKAGYRNFGLLYAYLGRYREAIKMMDKIIQIDLSLDDERDLARCYVEKAFWYLIGWNDVENAKRAIEKGLELKDAASLIFYEYLFRDYLSMGEYDKALSIGNNHLQQYVQLQDEIVRAHVHCAKGEYDNAIKEFEMQMQQGYLGEKLSCGYDLAWCYFEQGQNEKAVEAIQRMQRIYSVYYDTAFGRRAVVYPRSFYLLGRIYEKKGDKKPAIENYEKLLNLWKDADKDLPDLIDAKARLAKLHGARGER